ncbi:MAG TPA: hypothetical protein DIC52_04670, partial [Candidatus Latescibacteria bacterium]|nr:hypothetical protein [Candidatus Latescibacterota bacterium]
PADGSNIVDWRVSPVNTGEVGHSMHISHFDDGTGNQVIYGDDPSYFLGAEVRGGPSATGYWFEANAPWDLIFLFQPDLRSNVGSGFAFRGRFIIPDPDGDDSYGQTYFGGDQNDLGTNAKWPRFVLTDANTNNQTAVEATTWGAVKSLYR